MAEPVAYAQEPTVRQLGGGVMALRFEHRATETDTRIVNRVWRTTSDAEETMTSVARTCCHLIVTRTTGRLLVSLRGPETRATTAPVPPAAEFLGIRLTLGAVFRPHPATSIVDSHVSFPVTRPGRVVIGGEDWETPTSRTSSSSCDACATRGCWCPHA